MQFKKIGIFDSGIGGLSIAQQLIDLGVPEIVYYADKAFMPYGNKTPEQIQQRCKIIAEKLCKQNVDCIVIACHTASAYGTEELIKTYPNTPIINVLGPTAQTAGQITNNKKIGLLATPATIASKKYTLILQQLDPTITLYEQACPELALVIENRINNAFSSTEIKRLLTDYLAPLLKNNIDTLILGCTHYDFIKPIVQKLCGPHVNVITSNECALNPKLFQTGHSTKTTINVIGNSEQKEKTTNAINALLGSIGKHN